MQIKPVNTLARDKVDKLLANIPFYRDVANSEPWQYDLLLNHSRIIELAPGDIVLRKGDIDTWMYFVLKGQLAVYADAPEQLSAPINFITPGELFGDLAIFAEGRRNATVVADKNSREVILFGTDFSIFNNADPHAGVSRHTQLLFYRNMVHGVRWKLEVYRIQYPDHALVAKGRAVKMYLGAKGSQEELDSLRAQAQQLADVLGEWNREFGALSTEGDSLLDVPVIPDL